MTIKNSNLPEKAQWVLLIDAIVNKGNAYSIGDTKWNDFTRPPKDSFQGKCGTPACIIGWAYALSLSIDLIVDIFAPDPENSNAKFSYGEDPQWFTRKKTVMMLKHYVETAKWHDYGNMIKQGKVDWLIDEREAV